jgi:hypothetical protein
MGFCSVKAFSPSAPIPLTMIISPPAAISKPLSTSLKLAPTSVSELVLFFHAPSLAGIFAAKHC